MKNLFLYISLLCSLLAHAQDDRQKEYYALLSSSSPGDSCSVYASATLPSISGIQAWYKSDAGLTVSGGKISSWADQSGNGYNLTQATSVNQPNYVASQRACKPGVYFNGTQMSLLNSSFPNLSAITVFTVSNSLSENGAIIGKYNVGAGWLRLSIGQRIYRNGSNFTIATIPAGNNQLFSQITAIVDATATEGWENGVQTLTAAGVSSITTNTVPLEMAKYQNSSSATGFQSTTVLEVIIYNRRLTSTERASVEAYLKTRWNL